MTSTSLIYIFYNPGAAFNRTREFLFNMFLLREPASRLASDNVASIFPQSDVING